MSYFEIIRDDHKEDKAWPAVFFTTFPTDIHPSPTGNLYMATLVYRKLKELGYLD